MPIKPTTVPKVDSSGQTAAELAEQAGLGQESQGAVLEQMDQNVNPDAAVGSVLEQQRPMFSTSDQARNEEEDLGNKITEASTPTTPVTPATDSTGQPSTLSTQSQDAYDRGFELLTTAADTIKSDREQAVKNLQEQGKIMQADKATAQRMEKGAVGMKMARMGGFLGEAGSGVAYMQSLAQTHRLEVDKLELAKNQAIAAAKAAFDGKQIEAAQALMTEAGNYQTSIDNQRKMAMDEAKFAMDAQKFERESDSDTMSAWAAQGYSIEDIPESRFDFMDQNAGYDPGTSRGLYELVADEYSETKILSDITKAKTLSDYLATKAFGEPTKIGKDTYYGTDKGQIEIDENGNGTGIYLDENGDIISRDLGYVGKPQDGFQLIKDSAGNPWNWDPTTGQAFAMFNSKASWDSVAPEGSIWDNFGQRTVNIGECGALINDIYTDIHVGDTYEDKLKIVDESITSDTVKEGNIIVEPAGTTGHIASVEEVKIVDGKRMLRLFESNYNGDKKITHNRWVEADDPSLDFGSGTLRPEFISGTDGQGWVTEAEAARNEPLSPNEAASLGVPVGTTFGEAEDMGLTPKATLTGVQKIETERKLSNTYRQATKSFREAKRQIGIITTSYDAAIKAMADGESLNAASQGVLVSFQKLLDPDSVVRESEYDRSPRGTSLLNKIKGLKVKLEQGGAGVVVEDLKSFADLGREFLENDMELQNEETALFKRQADAWGLDLLTIIPKSEIEQLEEGEKTTENFTDLTEDDISYYESEGYTVTENEDGSHTISE